MISGPWFLSNVLGNDHVTKNMVSMCCVTALHRCGARKMQPRFGVRRNADKKRLIPKVAALRSHPLLPP